MTETRLGRTIRSPQDSPGPAGLAKPAHGALKRSVGRSNSVSARLSDSVLRSGHFRVQTRDSVRGERYRRPKIALPMRTIVAPSAMAASMSLVMPMDRVSMSSPRDLKLRSKSCN